MHPENLRQIRQDLLKAMEKNSELKASVKIRLPQEEIISISLDISPSDILLTSFPVHTSQSYNPDVPESPAYPAFSGPDVFSVP